MSPHNPRTRLQTHVVENQPVPLGDRDLWGGDPVLRHWAKFAGADANALGSFGQALGAEEIARQARAANRFPPQLATFDRGGRRLDEVEFHPAYHALMQLGKGSGYSSVAFEEGGSHATHAAMVYLLSGVEPGVCCPLTMTYAAIPALGADAGVAAEWRPQLMSRVYDDRSLPVQAKAGATLGMAMTEKQGGSDVRANATRAEETADGWRLTGHKWFCSAPMSDGFLTLAQAPGGLTCFLVPRWTPDGERNAIQLMRLKEKLGNRANASAEVEYHGAWAQKLGDEGAGVRTIIEMVHHTRLDTAMAPAGLMRAALSEALWWCEGRTAFQRRLIDQPLMRSVLADLALEVEGATALGMRVAQAFDGTSEADRALARIGVALAKFLSNKRAPGVIYEAMECLGGMGYVEDTPMPMLFRESPLNSIWEGSGNVICLDILRTLAREPAAGAALAAELDAARGASAAYDAALTAHRDRWLGLAPEAEARWFAESLGVLLAAATLLRHGDGPSGEAYAATRLGGPRGTVAGAFAGTDPAPILDRLNG